MDHLEEGSEGIEDYVRKNSYFVFLLVLIIGGVVYKFFASGLNLSEIENPLPMNTNIIETITGYFRKWWLASKMENDVLVVDNNQKDGLLDRIVEKMEKTDV